MVVSNYTIFFIPYIDYIIQLIRQWVHGGSLVANHELQCIHLVVNTHLSNLNLLNGVPMI